MNKYKKQFSAVAGGFCNDYKDQYIKYLEAELLVRDEQVQDLEASEDASNCILDDVSESKYYMLEYVSSKGELEREIKEGEIDIVRLKKIFDSDFSEFISVQRIYFR